MTRMKRLLPLLLIATGICARAQQTDKATVDSIHTAHFMHFLAQDLTAFASLYDNAFIDLGGGPDGNGKVEHPVDTAKLHRFYKSTDYARLKDQSISAIFDLDRKIVWNYEEVIANKGAISRFGFELKPGDIYIIYPPRKGQPLHDGWLGIYRKVNGSWKIVAAD
jgi:hypothetical protein